MKFTELDNVVNSLSSGAFLVSGDEKPNVMTIAWGSIGVMWFKPVFIVPVRQSRYTKEFIDKTSCFTVSVPYDNKMKEAINLCGVTSGRDTDKFSEAGLSTARAKSVNSHVIKGCNMYYECKVLYKFTLNKDNLRQEEIVHYANNDMHTLYIAEIVDSYSK